MTPDRFDEIERICHAALNEPADTRAAFLDAACAGDVNLRADVASLLAGASSADALLSAPLHVAPPPQLVAGQRLGPYEIAGEIGAGGMGAVYRARDTRLGRTVAIKVIAGAGVVDPAARERFMREARLVGSLNHPHICALYDVGREAPSRVGGKGEGGGREEPVDFLVMEYLAGETLADRLRRGPLPLAQALDLAAQIAGALDAAHKHGIIHRDLKPGNVMLTTGGAGRSGATTAKLLDFGLAKLKGHGDQPVAALTAMPTQPASLTGEGIVVGTLPYMAPEQLEGKEADARTDLWALGAILYEMLTGKRAFEGDSQVSLIGHIMNAEPAALSTLQPLAPPSLDRVVRKCLAKHADDRWDTAHDVADELTWIAEGGSQAAPAGLPAAARRSGRYLRWVAAGVPFVLLVAALAVTVSRLREDRPETPVVRFALPAPEGVGFRYFDLPALSPDGERIVFGGETADGRSLLWVHRLDALTAEPLAGSAVTAAGISSMAVLPFWSPDSRQIAFFTERTLMKTDLSGGAPQKVSDVPSAKAPSTYQRGGGAGGAWSREGVIVFGGASDGALYQVAATGGAASPVTALDTSRQETGHWFPRFLPDGRHFLYLARSAKPEHTGIFAGSLDGSPARHVLSVDSAALYAPPGYLLFAKGRVLMAQPFDARQLRVTGEAVRVAEDVALLIQSSSGLPTPIASVSENGVLCYLHDSAVNTQLTWFDRAGTRLGSLGEPGDYTNPALSPDGTRLAVGLKDAQSGTRDIWLIDVTRETSSRLTFDPADDFNPVWSPDGTRVAFSSNRKGRRDVYQKLASGAGSDEPMLDSSRNKSVEDWTPDGRFVIFNLEPPGKGTEVWALPVTPETQDSDRKPKPVLQGPGDRNQAQVSPDGRWMAYRSGESGRSEVYVQAFPPSGAKCKVSTGGGREPQWSDDPRELFYLEGARLMAVDLKAGRSTVEAGVLRTLFVAPVDPQQVRRNRYVVTKDGQRFLFITPLAPMARPLIVVVNWTGGLKR